MQIQFFKIHSSSVICDVLRWYFKTGLFKFFSAEKVEVQQQCEPAYQKHLTAAEDLRLPI